MITRHDIAASVALLAFLLAPLAHAAAPAPRAAAPAPRCSSATMIRPTDGAIVTRTVCVVSR